MTDIEYTLKEFHRALDLTRNDTPTLPSEETKRLRLRLIEEEYLELVEAIENDDLPGILQEAVDLVYVAVGACVSYGLPFNRGFDEVHNANMRKLSLCPECGGKCYIRQDPTIWAVVKCSECNGIGRVATRNEFGKILKPVGWQKPDIASLL